MSGAAMNGENLKLRFVKNTPTGDSYPWSYYSPYFRAISPEPSPLEKLMEMLRH